MPGSSVLPHTFLSCDTEPQTAVKSSPSGHHCLDPSPNSDAKVCKSDPCDSSGQSNADLPAEVLHPGFRAAVGSNGAKTNVDYAAPSAVAQSESVTYHSPLEPPCSTAGLSLDSSNVREQAGLQGRAPTCNAYQVAAAQTVLHTAVPAALVDGPQDTNSRLIPEAPPLADAPARPSRSPMQAPFEDSLVLPDSAGPTQHAQSPSKQQPVALKQACISPKPSQNTSDTASLEAAQALAILASGGKQPDTELLDASLSDAGESKLVLGECRQQQTQHKQCDSSHSPFKVIQRTAAVQRQPLKPEWQHSGRVTAGWGARGQRTHAQKTKLPQRGKTGKKQEQVSQADVGLSSEIQATDVDNSSRQGQGSQSLTDTNGSQTRGDRQMHTSSNLATSSQTAAGSKQAAQHAANSSEQGVVGNKAGSSKGTTGSKPADECRPAQDKPLKRSASQSQPHEQKSPVKHAGASTQQQLSRDSDDDDFKPDMRRRPRGHQSPQGIRKKARLSAEKATDGASADKAQMAQTNPTGQVLLRWDSASQQWDHQIITAFSASKVNASTVLCRACAMLPWASLSTCMQR